MNLALWLSKSPTLVADARAYDEQGRVWLEWLEVPDLKTCSWCDRETGRYWERGEHAEIVCLRHVALQGYLDQKPGSVEAKLFRDNSGRQ